MSAPMRIPVQMLGQSGCRMQFPAATVYVDPYLSHSVQELAGSDLVRQIPIPLTPDAVKDADWVLITHEHIDHCDPHTLPALATASPQARFIGPPPVARLLAEWGIDPRRLVRASEQDWLTLTPELQIRAVAAAHPEIVRDADGASAFVGYMLDYAQRRIYLAGDTSVRQEMIDTLKTLAPIHTAFLPVNEPNFFRDRRGIIGNMTVREAFQFAQEIGVRQVVAVHWDMFASNAVDPDEIRLIHQRLNPGFALLLQPEALNLADAQISVVIRTLNEVRYLGELLQMLAEQDTDGLGVEVVLVDSGSTDGTLAIAERQGCRIVSIRREEFSFGRSLNIGCETALGRILVFVSGHCVPTDTRWLQRLCQPLLEGKALYSYGRQLGGAKTYFSESRIFAKYFPEQSAIPQQGFYCNNANAALLHSAWQQYRFNEDLTGLEDMELAKRLVAGGGQVAYVAEAAVYHYHNETWPQVRRRFEREAIALQRIMPQVQVSLIDALRYFISSVWKDVHCARRHGKLSGAIGTIIGYRWSQYLGSYKGNHDHRKLSHAEKEQYFFPQ